MAASIMRLPSSAVQPKLASCSCTPSPLCVAPLRHASLRLHGRQNARRSLVRVALAEAPTSDVDPSSVQESATAQVESYVIDPETSSEMDAQELDEAQETLLKWMLFKDEQEQEADLDEMIDYSEFGAEEYEELFEELNGLYDRHDYNLQTGDKVTGTVIEVDDDGAYVDVGAKASAFLPTQEASFARLKTALEVVRPGMRREFLVVGDEDEYGQLMLSLGAIECSTFWTRVRQLQEEDVTVFVTVESANKGGLLVKYGQYEGFVPVSQFGPLITPDTMESLIGFDIPAKLVEVDEEGERLVFSNRRASLASSAQVQGFGVGQVVTGVVQSVKPYGAFIDLGGVTGLLHVSQISHERIASVDKILKEGDKLKVMVLSMDSDRGRVTLSTKKLEPTPGDMLRDPQLVFEKADEMGAAFRERVEVAESTSMAAGPMSYGAGYVAAGAEEGQFF